MTTEMGLEPTMEIKPGDTFQPGQDVIITPITSYTGDTESPKFDFSSACAGVGLIISGGLLSLLAYLAML